MNSQLLQSRYPFLASSLLCLHASRLQRPPPPVSRNHFHGRFAPRFRSAGTASSTLSPANGFGLDAQLDEPLSLAVDASGSLWVSDFGGNTVTQFIGLASPIRPPLLRPPAQP